MDHAQLIEAVRACNGQLTDEVLGRVICMLKGVEFVSAHHDAANVYINGNTEHAWYGWQRMSAPDVSIDAALALAIEIFGAEIAMEILVRATQGHFKCEMIAHLMLIGMLYRFPDEASLMKEPQS